MFVCSDFEKWIRTRIILQLIYFSTASHDQDGSRGGAALLNTCHVPLYIWIGSQKGFHMQCLGQVDLTWPIPLKDKPQLKSSNLKPCLGRRHGAIDHFSGGTLKLKSRKPSVQQHCHVTALAACIHMRPSLPHCARSFILQNGFIHLFAKFFVFNPAGCLATLHKHLGRPVQLPVTQ